MYTKITKENALYQPRENIKSLIESNLSDKATQIYSSFPDITARNFKGFPFIVIPDASNETEEMYTGTSVYGELGILEGTIYHDKDKLGDDKLRTIKQNILQAINKKDNQKQLSLYGIEDPRIRFDMGSESAIIISSKAIVQISFTIEFKTEVVY